MTIEPLTPVALRLFIAGFTGPKGENAFGEWLIGEAHHAGWLICHFRPAMVRGEWRTAVSGDKGLPDIIATRDGRIIFVELKTEHGKLSLEQAVWMSELQKARHGMPYMKGDGLPEVYLWRPSGRDKILEILE